MEQILVWGQRKKAAAEATGEKLSIKVLPFFSKSITCYAKFMP
jgi:hypothetical protein